jgi:Uma2 family endonuclease
MPASHGSGDVKPGAAGRGMKLTYDDFLLFPDDGKRHELIDGEHYVTPSPNTKHQRVSGNLHFIIRAWLEEHPVGQIFYAPFDVVFSRFDVVEPDLLYVSNERGAEVLTDQHVTGAPDIVIEIGSPSTRKRDETIKRRLYERSGVSEYWVVDPELDLVRVYRREGDVFSRPNEFSREAGDGLTTPHLAGLHIPLSRVFGGAGLEPR